MKKTSLILTLILLLILTGCKVNSNNDSNEDVVWKSYTNRYYGIKYPEEWEVDDYDDYIYFDLDGNPSNYYAILRIEFDIEESTYHPPIDSEEDFDLFIQSIEDKIASTDDTINENKDITIDGHKAHRFETADNIEKDEKEIIVYIYQKPRQLVKINYYAKNGLYDDYEGIVNEMIDSFEIF